MARAITLRLSALKGSAYCLAFICSSATFQPNVASPPVPISIAYSKRKKALGISGVLANVYSWSCRPFVDATGAEWRGGQIDMLIDRADGAINICEMKYAKDEFVIDASYEQRLRDRMSSFSVATKTKKALLHTFITTYGVKQNMHSGLVNSEVRMNDLFEKANT